MGAGWENTTIRMLTGSFLLFRCGAHELWKGFSTHPVCMFSCGEGFSKF